jgi:oligogalacturonide transport system substrate-binding protein
MRTANALALDQFSARGPGHGVVQGRLNALPVSYTARVLLWNEASFGAPAWRCPQLGRAVRRRRAVSASVLGEGAYPLDGELYDMLLLAQAWVQQRHGTPYVDPLKPRVAMTEAAALDWVRTYQRLVGEQVATPLPLRASLGGAEKPTEQQPDWVNGRWAGNYTWDSAIGCAPARCPSRRALELGASRPARRRDSGIFGRPTRDVRGGPQQPQRRTAAAPDELPAHRPRGRAAAGPHARAAVGAQPAGAAAGREPPAAAGAGGGAEQIQAAARGRPHPLPSPLFEHARLQKFMREVFETVAYGKADATSPRAAWCTRATRCSNASPEATMSKHTIRQLQFVTRTDPDTGARVTRLTPPTSPATATTSTRSASPTTAVACCSPASSAPTPSPHWNYHLLDLPAAGACS